MAESNLLMPFIDQSESFTNGFEMGKLWQSMMHNELITNQIFHVENSEQVRLLCDYFGYEYKIIRYDDTWGYLTATPVDISGLVK